MTDTIPIGAADVMDDTGIAHFLQSVPDGELSAATRLAEAQHDRAADAGWVGLWGDLTESERARAVITALGYLRAARSIGLLR